jgi:hypothetical protein
MATINYWGLSGVKGSVTVNLTITIDQLISAIAADESLPTDYYKISVLNNPAINDTTYGDSSSTLTQIGIVDGDTILSTPNQVGTKEDRQIQKLEIAKAARTADGNARSTYTITDLPTKYTGNAVTDNANVGGLVVGRPWIAVAPPPPVTSGSIFIPGTSSRVTLTPGIVVGGTSTTPFTVEGWFYSTVTPGTDSGPVLLSTDTSNATPAYAKALTVNIGSTTTIVVDSNGAAQQAFNFAETMLVNTWYYVAVTRDSGGYIQVWLGKDGDANATVSTTARLDTSANAAWELTGLSNTIGAFVPAGRYTTGYISNLRVDSTSLYATTAATIPVPTAPFAELAGTVFLQNDDTLTDQTGTQTLAAVGSAAGDALNPF